MKGVAQPSKASDGWRTVSFLTPCFKSQRTEHISEQNILIRNICLFQVIEGPSKVKLFHKYLTEMIEIDDR